MKRLERRVFSSLERTTSLRRHLSIWGLVLLAGIVISIIDQWVWAPVIALSLAFILFLPY